MTKTENIQEKMEKIKSSKEFLALGKGESIEEQALGRVRQEH